MMKRQRVIVLTSLLFMMMLCSTNAWWGRRRRRRCSSVNCQVSSWSSWSSCSTQCGTDGRQTRSRHVTRQASCGGSCSYTLSDSRSCNVPGCNGRGSPLSRSCSCSSGWHGTCCHYDTNECQSSNGGCHHVCVNTPGSFRCQCRNGYQLLSNGKSCQDTNECQSSNGGCDHVCVNTQGSFQCQCRSGYELLSDGKSCQDTNECQSSYEGCDHVCVNTPGSFQCQCRSGYELLSDGKSCQDTNECQSSNGGCQHTCENTIGSYLCHCYGGYQLLSNKQSCADIDECSSGNGHCEHICQNTAGSYSCSCYTGYELGFDSTGCQDENECLINNGGCKQVCQNTLGSYSCSCLLGYQVTGVNECEDIDECQDDNGSCRHVCYNTAGSFYCSCEAGYTIDPNDGQSCTDINECTDTNDCNQICTNTIGSFYCSCEDGFSLADNQHLCEDIDECNFDVCEQVCVNTQGSYLCTCDSGYIMEGHNCSDFNECLHSNGGCDHECQNTVGSYTCSCRSGYILGDDGKVCNDIDECLDINSECIQQCENLPGTYECMCLPGYQGDPLVDCQDVDECQDATSACEQGCLNTPGSFQCICQPGYSLDFNRRTCSTNNACEDGNHGCKHICQSLRGQASCSCYPGYSLASDNRTCIDMDECEEGINLCDQTCQNTNGSYICSCEFGFVLSQDAKSCRDICVPHSCHHGRCVPSEDNTPACDCTDSGYEGEHCEIGVITVQEMPSLIAGETYPITIEARPDSDLTIVPMSDHVEFIPPTLMFTSEQTSLQTTVIPKKSGELTAVLQLFGSSARAYQQAQFYLSVLSAFEKFDISDFSLPFGCHDEFLSQCPAPSTLFLALSSTSTWYQLKGNSNVRYTLGIVFLDVSGFRLPISLKGIQIIQTTWQFTIQALPTTIRDGDGLVINSNQNTEAKCSDFNVTVYDIEEFIENDSFLRTFIAGLVEKLPDWIKLIYRGMEYVSFNDISASMNQGKDLVGISSCRGAPVYNDYLYTTFQFKGNANVSVFGEMVSLPDPLVGRKFCLLVDLCNDFLGTVILMFPKDSRIDLATFSFLNFLADKNWSLTLGGVGLSYSRKLSPIETDVELWNGDHYFSYEQPSGHNAWMKFYVSKDDDGNGKIGFSVDGQLTMMLSVQDLEKAFTHILVARWDALILLEAGLNLHFRLKIFGQQVDISFEALRATAIGYLSIGGFGRKWCGESADPPGLFLNLLFNIQPFGNSQLAQFFLPRIDITVSAFLNYDVSDRISSMPFDDSIITPLLNALKPDVQQLLSLITNFTTSLHSHLDQAISEELSNLRTQATELRTEIENTLRSLPTSMIKDIPDIVSPLKTSIHGLQTSWKNFKNELVTRSHHLKSDIIVYMERYVNEIKQSIDEVVKNYLYHMLSLKDGLSGVGFRFASKLKIFGLDFGLVEVELVASSKLGQCSKFSHVYQHLEDEIAVRGLVVLPFYFTTGGIRIKQVGHELAFSLERYAFIFRFMARIQILGLISSEANLFINQEFVFFEVEGKIWDICYAVISARVSVLVPWQDQMWMIAGEFGFGTRSFPLAMSEALAQAAENFGQTANDRLTMAQDSLDTAIAKLEDGKSWLDKRKADVDKANIWFDSAVNALRQVEDSLDSMRDEVKGAKDWLREKQRDIDKLCKIKTCKKLCIPGIKCRICIKRIWGVKIPLPCCRFTNCMFKIPDIFCIAANVICAAIRALAFVILKIAEVAVGVVLLAFDATKLLVQAAQIVVDKSRVVLEIAKVGLDLAKGALTVVQGILRGAQLALEAVKILLAAGIEVFKFIVRYGLGAIVDFKRSWFKIEVSTFNIFVFEVGIEVELFRLGMRELSVTINFKNFLESIWNAAVAIIKTIAEFLLPFRKRRSIESGFGGISNSYNQSNFNNDTLHIEVPYNDLFKNGTENVATEDEEMELRIRMFEEKCIIFEELADYLTEAMTVLYDIAFDSNDGMGNASDVLNGIDDMIQNITNIEKNNTGINVTEAYFNYNLTEEEIELAITDVNITENPAVNESINALATVKDTTLAEISSASDYHILAPWKQVMMNYTAQVFTEDECASFEDCLFYTFDQMYSLYENVDLPNITTMRSLIIDAKQQFFAVLRNDSLRIADAEAVAAGILDLLQESRELKIFCATPPTIIQQPSSVTTLEGSNITLFCTAEADPMVSYTWYKDGRIISSAVLVGELHLSTVSDSTRGWYFCQAGNHVVNVTSVEVYVDVHKVPVITAVSEYKLVLEGEEPPIVLSCNSTGWPLPSIRWFFASTQSTYTPLDVKADSLLLEKPRRSQTGSYTCEASNVVGKDTSKEIKIMVVGTSFAVPLLTVSFEIYDSVLYEDHISTCGTFTMEGGVPLYDLQDAIFKRLQSILGIDAERVVDLAVRKTGQGAEINGEVLFNVLAGNMPPITSTVDSPYEQLESLHGTARKELSVLGNILQEASFQEQVMFDKDGCRASLKSGTMAWSNIAARCPAGYHVHDTQIFLCVCCAPGQYRADAVNSSFCLPCPFGTYQHSMCSSSCIPCLDGLTTKEEGSADVDKCNVPVLKPTPTNITESKTEQTMEGHVTEISVGSAALALLIGCSIIVIIVFLRRRRRTKKWSTTDDVNHPSNEPDQTANELAVLHCNPVQPAAEFDNPVVPD